MISRETLEAIEAMVRLAKQISEVELAELWLEIERVERDANCDDTSP